MKIFNYKKIFIILLIVFITNIGLAGFIISGTNAANAPIYDEVLKEKLNHIKEEVGLPGTEQIEDRPLDLVVKIIRIALGFLALVFLILILYAGFSWMTSAGNSEQINKAKGIIKAALIGILIIFFAYTITYFVFNLMNDRWRY